VTTRAKGKQSTRFGRPLPTSLFRVRGLAALRSRVPGKDEAPFVMEKTSVLRGLTALVQMGDASTKAVPLPHCAV